MRIPMLMVITLLVSILTETSLSPKLRGDVVGADGQPLLSQPDNAELLKIVLSRKFDEARAKIDAAKENAPDSPQREVMLAALCFQAGLMSDGRSILEKIAIEQPEAFDVRLALAERAVSEQRWFEALLHIRSANESTPLPSWSSEYQQRLAGQLLLYEGLAHEARADYHNAIRAYEASCQSLTTGEGYLGQGRSLLHLGEPERAIDAFTKARQQNSSLPTAELTMADWFQTKGDEASVDNWLKKAIETGSDAHDQQEARLARARWLLDRNQPKEAAELIVAEKYTTEGLEIERQYLQALAARMIGDYPTAIRLLSTLHQREPTSLAYGNQLALVLIEDSAESSRARALQIAELNVRNHSKMAETWAALGWIQLRMGDLERAGVSLKNAQSSGVISRDTAFYLAEYAARIDQPKEADKLRQQIAEAKGPFFYADHYGRQD